MDDLSEFLRRARNLRALCDYWRAESARLARLAEQNYQNARLYEVLTGVNVPE